MSSKQERQEAMRDLVRGLSTRQADEVEKVLLHILDTARTEWNTKANAALMTLREKNSGKSEVELTELRKTYEHAFEQSIKIGQMRFGVAKKKRVLGEKTTPEVKKAG